MRGCLNGDATDAQAWSRLLGGRPADALVTDPPYCILVRRRRGGDEREPKGRKLERGPLRRFEDVRAYRTFTRAWLSNACAHLAPRSPLVLWTNLLGRAPLLAVAAELGYGALLGELVWGKRTRVASGGEVLLRVVEMALVLAREPLPAARPADPARPWAVVTGAEADGEAGLHGGHPSHKPFAVLEPLLRTWTRPGDLVVDPFAGSGAIPAAALKLGRAAACMELEAEWCARTDARLAGSTPP